jgi:hypothetical protein
MPNGDFKLERENIFFMQYKACPIVSDLKKIHAKAVDRKVINI